MRTDTGQSALRGPEVQEAAQRGPSAMWLQRVQEPGLQSPGLERSVFYRACQQVL